MCNMALGNGALRGVPARKGGGCRVSGRSEGEGLPLQNKILKCQIMS